MSPTPSASSVSSAAPAGTPSVVRVATRGSKLARWQASEVAAQLSRSHPDVDVELVVVETEGDQRRDVPIWELSGQGVFVKEVQAAVLDGRADVAVHSAKDLTSVSAPGLALAAVLERGDPRDALVGRSLSELPRGAVVATGSVRRQAQLAWKRPDLQFIGLRGNIATRLSKVPAGGAVVVAAAALERLGLMDSAAELLDPSVMVPQVAQGAIAVECSSSSSSSSSSDRAGWVRSLVSALDDPSTRLAVTAERAFLARLGGGCDLPVGAHCAGGVLTGVLASPDGRALLRDSVEVGERAGGSGGAGSSRAAGSGAGDLAPAEKAGRELAEKLLEAGGAGLLNG